MIELRSNVDMFELKFHVDTVIRSMDFPFGIPVFQAVLFF